jgi:cytidylate kinase
MKSGSAKGDAAVPILTISRQMGSLGDEIAQEMARRLGWDLLDHSQLIQRFFSEGVTEQERQSLSESARYFLNRAPDGQTYIDRLERGLNRLAEEKPLILLGFGSQVIFSENDDAVHVRITAPSDIRLERVRQQFNATEDTASQILDQADRRHRRFVSTLFGMDCADESLYHLILIRGSCPWQKQLNRLQHSSTFAKSCRNTLRKSRSPFRHLMAKSILKQVRS